MKAHHPLRLSDRRLEERTAARGQAPQCWMARPDPRTMTPSLHFLSASSIGISPQLFSMPRSLTEEAWLDHLLHQWSS
jgi:hypothetical protein